MRYWAGSARSFAGAATAAGAMDPRRDLVLPPVASRVALADRYGVGPGEGTGDGGGSGHALHLLPLPTGVPPLAVMNAA